MYFAFRELGRVIRTIFLRRSIGDAEVRSTMHAATNKSEEFNNFAKWSFFGNDGVIAENVRHEQCKIVKYKMPAPTFTGLLSLASVPASIRAFFLCDL